MMHETTRNRSTTREASPTGSSVVKSGQKSVGRGASLEFLRKLRFSLESNISEKRFGWASSPTYPRSDSKAFWRAEKATGEISFKGIVGGRLSNRFMDIKPYRKNNQAKVWDSIPSLPCLEDFAEYRLELSEAGAAGVAKGRKKDSLLEAFSMAAYKKRLNVLERIWFLSTNPVFCLFPMLSGLGRPKGKRPIFTIFTGKIGFRRSVPFLCRPKRNDWHFIFNYAKEISKDWMSTVSWKAFLSISRDIFSYCGTGDLFTAVKRFNNSLLKTQDFTWNIFPHTRRNLTRRNMFGINPIVLFQILRQKTWASFVGICENQSAIFADLKNFFGRAFTPRICPGRVEYFHYLCKAQ